MNPLIGPDGHEAQTRLSVIDFQQRVTQSGGDLKVLANVLGQAQQGNIPSYDERLGITRAEFQRYLYLIFSKTLEPMNAVCREEAKKQGVAFIDVTEICKLAQTKTELNPVTSIISPAKCTGSGWKPCCRKL